jgi:hypothetical protein
VYREGVVMGWERVESVVRGGAGVGMMVKRRKQRKMERRERKQGIQGEMSVVKVAMEEAIISAM